MEIEIEALKQELAQKEENQEMKDEIELHKTRVGELEEQIQKMEDKMKKGASGSKQTESQILDLQAKLEKEKLDFEKDRDQLDRELQEQKARSRGLQDEL